MTTINLPKNSGEVVTGHLSDYFAPYISPKVGDYLLYNPVMDKMVIVPIYDRPDYIIQSVSNHILKRNKIIGIRRL